MTGSRCAGRLWPEEGEAEHRSEVDAYLAGDFTRQPWHVLVAHDDERGAIGFAELSIRSYAEGCTTARVAYLEGWFVAAPFRGRGVGQALIAAAEAWGREQQCSEFASDADPENAVSRSAHLAAGFEDVGLVRCFRKDL